MVPFPLFSVNQLDSFGEEGVYRSIISYIGQVRDQNFSGEQILAKVKKEVLPQATARFEALAVWDRQVGMEDFEVFRNFFTRLNKENYPAAFKFGATGVVHYIYTDGGLDPQQMTYKAIADLEALKTNGQIPAAQQGDYEYTLNYFRAVAEVFAGGSLIVDLAQTTKEGGSNLTWEQMFTNLLTSIHGPMIYWGLIHHYKPEYIPVVIGWFLFVLLQPIMTHEIGHWWKAKALKLLQLEPIPQEIIGAEKFDLREGGKDALLLKYFDLKDNGNGTQELRIKQEIQDLIIQNRISDEDRKEIEKKLRQLSIMPKGFRIPEWLKLDRHRLKVEHIKQHDDIEAFGPIFSAGNFVATALLGVIAAASLKNTNASFVSWMLWNASAASFPNIFADHGAFFKWMKDYFARRERRSKAPAKIESGDKGDFEMEGKSLLKGSFARTIVGPDGKTWTLPTLIYCNMINGGRHSSGSNSVQEMMVIPIGAKTIEEALRMLSNMQKSLEKYLVKNVPGGLGERGDEGGSAPILKDDEEALKLLMIAARDSSLRPGIDIAFAIDIGASELAGEAEKARFGQGHYLFWKSRSKDVKSYNEMIDMYRDWLRKYPIISIEDGLGEFDEEGWKTLQEELGGENDFTRSLPYRIQRSGIQVMGDDLDTTNPRNTYRLLTKGTSNSVLIKDNQIGTLTETVMEVQIVRSFGATAVPSHRSGETEDDFLAYLAASLGFEDIKGGHIKTGAMQRSDRIAKYNTLRWIGEYLEGRIKRPRRAVKPLDEVTIVSVRGLELQDARGNPTVGCRIEFSDGTVGMASVPSGASTGSREAYEKRDGDAERYHGKGVLNAVNILNNIIPARLIGKKLSDLDQFQLDKLLVDIEWEQAQKEKFVQYSDIHTDATEPYVRELEVKMYKRATGANTSLAVSRAFAKAYAESRNINLFQYLAEILSRKVNISAFYDTTVDFGVKGFDTTLLTHEKAKYADPAVLAVSPRVKQNAQARDVGGIYINPKMFNMQILKDINGIPLSADQQPIMKMNVDGFVPVFIYDRPFNGLSELVSK